MQINYKLPNCKFNSVLIIVTWHWALKVSHAVHDPYALEKKMFMYN